MSQMLIIRADAHSSIGAGHLMRCLALAQQWQSYGGECLFVTALDAGALFKRIEEEGMAVKKLIDIVPGSKEDIETTIKIGLEFNAPWVALDGYVFTAHHQKMIKDAGLNLLCVDDNVDYEHYYADIILNQNIHASKAMYPPQIRESYTQVLAGVKYCLLRKPFIKRESEAITPSQGVSKIMITLGGSDPQNATGTVLNALNQLDDSLVQALKIKIVAGSGNKHTQFLRKNIEGSSFSGELIVDADDEEMIQTALWADLVISAMGSTVWELMSLKVPFLGVVLAENQMGIAEYLSANFNVPMLDVQNDSEILQNTILNGISNPPRIDFTEVSTRITEIIKRMNWSSFRLRTADENDSTILWQWTNDPIVRAHSFSSEAILWENHSNWFTKKLASSDSIIYVAETVSGDPAGMIRFDVDGEELTIGFSVSHEFRGKYLGVFLLTKGAEEVKKVYPSKMITGVVKIENGSSCRAFISAGYSENETVEMHGCKCRKYYLNNI